VIAILRSYYIAKVIFSFKNFGGVYSPRKYPRHYLLMIFPAINPFPQFRFYTQDLSALKSSCRKSPVIAILRSYYNKHEKNGYGHSTVSVIAILRSYYFAKVIFFFKNFGGVYSPRKYPRHYLLMIFPAINPSPQFRFYTQD